MKIQFKIFSLLCILSATTIATAQVGIGTTTPEEDLHIVGTLRVETTDDSYETTALIGADDSGTLAQLSIDNSLSIINNTLEIAASYKFEIGDVDMSAATILNTLELPDLDLKIGPNEENEGKTLIYLNNFATTGTIKVTGIKSGTDGMHIYILNTNSSVNLQFLGFDSPGQNNSAPQNKLNVLTSSETTSGYVAAEFLYDENSQKWLLLNVHD